MEDSGQLLAGTSTISEMRLRVAPLRWESAMVLNFTVLFLWPIHTFMLVVSPVSEALYLFLIICICSLVYIRTNAIFDSWFCFRYIHTHGLQSMLPSTTWVCGTWGLSFGHDSTLANSFICVFIQHQPQSETSFQSQRMHVSVVRQVGDTLDLFEL